MPPAAGPSAAPRMPAATQMRSAAFVAALELREEVERRRDDERRADRLHAARADEHLEGRRETAGERRSGEHDAPGHERLARAPPRDVRGGHGEQREDEVERREHPGDRRDRDVELAEDLRERERDDRGVREREPDGNPEQSRAHDASLGAALPSDRCVAPASATVVAAGFLVRRRGRGDRRRATPTRLIPPTRR